MRRLHPHHYPAQPPLLERVRGSVLIVSLVILLLMTIIGISAVSTNALEERMVGNMRDTNLAFQAAEAALREGETIVTGLSFPCGAACYSGALPDYLDDAFWTANGNDYSAFASHADSEVSADPQYVVEELDRDADAVIAGEPETGRQYYRITALGVGGAATSRVVLQSTYYVKY
jgi:type IV pilus assembly protein PilX